MNRGWLMRVVGVVQQPEGVRQHVKDCIELFDAALCTAWRVDDDGVTPDAGKTARESAKRIAKSHCFGQARRFSFDHGPSALRGLVPRRKTGAPCRHDETSELFGHLGQCGSHVASAIGGDALLNDVEASVREMFDQCSATLVFTRAMNDTVAAGQDLGLQPGQCVAHAIRR